MTLGNVNAKILIEKAIQDYYRNNVKFHKERIVVRRIAAFDMFYTNNMTYTEIADVVGVNSLSTIRHDIDKVFFYVRWFLMKQLKIKTVAEAFETV